MTPALSILPATTEAHYAAAKALMLEYLEGELADDYAVGGSGLKQELAAFPGPYAPPRGLLLLAMADDVPCGCLALRPLSDTQGEIMRMYVQPPARGRGIAALLMRALIARAAALGYTELFLDSLHKFTAAHGLYEKLGFTYCPPYDPNTTEAMQQQMVFMRLIVPPPIGGRLGGGLPQGEASPSSPRIASAPLPSSPRRGEGKNAA